MSLFQWGEFTSAAGLVLPYKIECDGLTPEDWTCIAAVGVTMLPPFRWVYGVPRGGLKLARAINPYRQRGSETTLICDDVWTTGQSLRKVAEKIEGPWIGYVAFARGPLPDSVKAFCTVNQP